MDRLDLSKIFNMEIKVMNKDCCIATFVRNETLQQLIDNNFKESQVNINLNESTKQIIIYSLSCPLHLEVYIR